MSEYRVNNEYPMSTQAIFKTRYRCSWFTNFSKKVKLKLIDTTFCFLSCYSDLPPSQGGKYAGFGNTVDPPPRSSSTNDFYDYSANGLTNVRILVFFRYRYNYLSQSYKIKLVPCTNWVI